MLSLTVMEWEDKKTTVGFIEFMKKYYPDKDSVEVVDQINKWLVKLKKEVSWANSHTHRLCAGFMFISVTSNFLN